MSKGISIDLVKIDECISKLTEIKKKVTDVQESQKKLVESLKNSWDGTTGEDVNKKLVDNNQKFESLVSNLDSKIIFLQNVKKAYAGMDEGISSKIDNNTNNN